ncbi:hypothetical protein C8J56DRAFT_1060031 [Mycena floridula]|nr:hypothetical protein C8J56DRAFT_1060031 [Mycena floridula]
MSEQSQEELATTLARLASSPLYRLLDDTYGPMEQRQEISHQRCKTMSLAFNFTLEDILTRLQHFARFSSTLPVATVAQYAANRPDLIELCEKMLKFEISAQYMLMEVGHGLDTQNIETQATLLSDGGFDFHTPNAAAAKSILSGFSSHL